MKKRLNINLFLVAIGAATMAVPLHAVNVTIDAPETEVFNNPWVLQNGELLDMNGGAVDFATLSGAFFLADDGMIQCDQRCRMTNPVMFAPGVEVELGTDAHVELDGLNTVRGGDFDIESGAALRFDGNTLIEGGNFDIAADATVALTGNATLEGGTFTGDGVLNFLGTVTIDEPVTVDCRRLEFDGFGLPNHVITINDDLTINSDFSNSGVGNRFSSTLNINGANTQLRVNTANYWEMSGTMNQTTGNPGTSLSIDGIRFKMSGTANISGGTSWGARAWITGTVNLADESSTLQLTHFDGLWNEIEGGTIAGAGKFRSVLAKLRGYGTINADLDFGAASQLIAKEGKLELNGSLINTPLLMGTFDDDSILETVEPWVIADFGALDMDGGIVQGGAIENNNIIRGHGDLRPQGLTNNGSITAEEGKTLVIDTVNVPDLDGTGTAQERAMHTLNATDGDITVTAAIDYASGGTVNVSPGRTLDFKGGWALDTTGTLNLTGDTVANPAELDGSYSLLHGTVNVVDAARMSSSTAFRAPCSLTMADPQTVVELNGPENVIETGVSVTGSGTIAVGEGILAIDDMVSVDASVANIGGELHIGLGTSTATALAENYSQGINAELSIDLAGAPESDDVDRFIVAGHVDLDGRLSISMENYVPQGGEIWRIVEAGSLSGTFSSLFTSGVPAGYTLRTYHTNDGVYIKLVAVIEYGDWAEDNGLTDEDNGVDADPDGDGIGNGLEMFLGGDPLSQDPDLAPRFEVITVDGADYISITITIRNEHIPADLGLLAQRSTDLSSWSDEEVVTMHGVADLLTCTEERTYRSSIAIGEIPREYLRLFVSM